MWWNCFLFTLVLFGIVRTIQCGKKEESLELQLENAISDQLLFGKKLAERGDYSIKTMNDKLDESKNTLVSLYNHSLAIFSGQVENVQRMLKKPIRIMERSLKNETQKLKQYQTLVKSLNKAIKKNNAACKRTTPLYETDNSLETLFMKLKGILPLLMTMQDDNCPTYTSSVTTCKAIQSLPTSCVQAKPGIQKLMLEGNVYEILCEEGGWTVLMRRSWPKSIEFVDEKEHGNLCSEFLLDQEPIIRLLKAEAYVLHLEAEQPKFSSFFKHIEFQPNNKENEYQYVLSARGIKVPQFKDRKNFKNLLAVKWVPFESNIKNIIKIRIRPATLGIP